MSLAAEKIQTQEVETAEAEIIAFPSGGRHFPKNVRVDIAAKRAMKRNDDEIVRLTYENFVTKMNAATAEYGLKPLTVAEISAKGTYVSMLVARYRSSGGDMAYAIGIYENQIGIIAQVLAAMLEDPRHIALLAETQYGKTGILCGSIILFNLYQHELGKKTFVRLVNPNFLGVERQTMNDLDQFNALLAPLCLNGVTSFEANAVYFNQTKRLSRKANTNKNNAREAEIIRDIANGYDPILNQCGYESMFVFVDEADEALNGSSFMNKMMAACAHNGLPTRFLFCSATAWEYKFLKGFNVIEAPVNDDYAGFLRGRQIPVCDFISLAQLIKEPELEDFSISSHYKKHEVAFKIIESLSKGINPARKTTVRDYDPYGKKGHQWIERQATAGEIGFNGLPFNGGAHMAIRYGKNNGQLNYLRGKIQRRLARMGLTFLTYVGGKQGTTMIVYAPGHPDADEGYVETVIPTEQCQTIMEMLESAEKIFAGYREYHGFKTFHAVIGVVALARRAMRLPKECNLFVELSEYPTNMTALEQGSLGRLTGWGKFTDRIAPMCIMSKDVTKTVKKARYWFGYHGRKIAVISPSQYAAKTFQEPTLRVAVTVGLFGKDWETFSPALKASLRRVASVIESQTYYAPSKSGDGKKKGLLSPIKLFRKSGGNAVSETGEVCEGWDFDGDGYIRREFVTGHKKDGTPETKAWTLFDLFGLLGEDSIAELEQHFSDQFGETVTLLRPGQVRSDGRHYASEGNFVHMAYRSYEADLIQGEGKFGAMSQREGRDPTVKNNGWAKNVIDPSAIMSTVDKKLAKLVFILKSDSLNHHGLDEDAVDFTYCKKGTAPYHQLATAEERATIDAISR